MRRRVAMLLGDALARVHLNDVELNKGQQGNCIRKQRRWWSGLLLPPGNLLTGRHPIPVRVLSKADWLAHEAQVSRAMESVQRGEHGEWLETPVAPGRVLSSILASERESLTSQAEALRLAAVALGELHTLEISGGEARPLELLSHGDATVENVACDFESKRATWFDFDTMHDRRIGVDLRRADDLRALIYSASGRAIHLEPETIVKALFQGYDGAAVFRALAELVQNPKIDESLWHHAQARISVERQRRCREAILVWCSEKS